MLTMTLRGPGFGASKGRRGLGACNPEYQSCPDDTGMCDPNYQSCPGWEDVNLPNSIFTMYPPLPSKPKPTSSGGGGGGATTTNLPPGATAAPSPGLSMWAWAGIGLGVAVVGGGLVWIGARK